MSDFNYISVVKEAADDSHKIYLANWETKTQFAEADGVWNADIQHRVHEAIENLASNGQILGVALAEALARIDALEAQLKNQK
jgi:hypothetical protein